jgi:hypothetical protein
VEGSKLFSVANEYNRFMSNVDNCSTILDPKYNGECLGVNISFLLFHDITSWAPYFWRDSVLARVSALQSEMHEFARRMLEAHAKAIDAKYSTPADSAVRMQQHTLLQVPSPSSLEDKR